MAEQTARIGDATKQARALPRRRGWLRHLTSDRALSLLLISPSVLGIAVFVYGFIALTGYTSFVKWDTFVPDYTFVGLRNYIRLWDTERFRIDLGNTFTFTVLFLLTCLLMGFILAVLLDQRIRGEGIFRSIFLFPLAISFIVTGVVWRWLLDPGNLPNDPHGVNLIFDALGLRFLENRWYTDPSIGIKAIVIAATWQMSGYVMAMYLAGMRGIPEDLREAARVDGATEFQIYRHIIVPMLQPITLGAVIIIGHISLKIFDLVVSMTGRGVAFSTDVPALFMFDVTFRENGFAEGAAVATILLLSVAVLIVPYLIYSMRTEAER
jgi:glucose/mannose transport system permease protein